MNDWIAFAVDAIGGGAAFICLFEGTRRLVGGLRTQGAVAMVVLGAGYCLSYGGYFLWKERVTREYADALYRQVYSNELPANWGDNLPAARRESGSLALARDAYIGSGTLRTYFDAAGARKPFSPTQADMRRRDRVVATQTRLEEGMRESLASGVLWLVWAAIAVVFGFGLSREK